jgi:hypothetical protein
VAVVLALCVFEWNVTICPRRLRKFPTLQQPTENEIDTKTKSLSSIQCMSRLLCQTRNEKAECVVSRSKMVRLQIAGPSDNYIGMRQALVRRTSVPCACWCPSYFYKDVVEGIVDVLLDVLVMSCRFGFSSFHHGFRRLTMAARKSCTHLTWSEGMYQRYTKNRSAFYSLTSVNLLVDVPPVTRSPLSRSPHQPHPLFTDLLPTTTQNKTTQKPRPIRVRRWR